MDRKAIPQRIGTCYKAAGWVPLGQTQGFTRVNRQNCDFYVPNDRPKAVWAKPLGKDAFELLNARMLPGDCVGGAQGDGTLPRQLALDEKFVKEVMGVVSVVNVETGARSRWRPARARMAGKAGARCPSGGSCPAGWASRTRSSARTRSTASGAGAVDHRVEVPRATGRAYCEDIRTRRCDENVTVAMPSSSGKLERMSRAHD